MNFLSYLLSTGCVPGTALEHGCPVLNKINMVPAFMEPTFQWEKMINQKINEKSTY